MTPERWRRIKELFEAALQRPPEERPSFLAEACGEDSALRDEVLRLLAADNYDNTYTYNLSCNTGDKICYCASDPNGYWGVGVLDAENCPDCCYTCENASVSIELVCTTTATDRAKLRLGTQRVQQIPFPTSYLLPTPTLGPNPAGTTATLGALTIPVRGVAPCGKGNALGVNGGRYRFTMRPAFALWGTSPLGA